MVRRLPESAEGAAQEQRPTTNSCPLPGGREGQTEGRDEPDGNQWHDVQLGDAPGGGLDSVRDVLGLPEGSHWTQMTTDDLAS